MSESLLVQLLRAGRHPTGGGVLCTTGDCMNCVVRADGVDYVRSCQVDAASVTSVELHPRDSPPPLPLDAPDPVSNVRVSNARVSNVRVSNVHHPVVVVGGGPAGRAALAAETDAVVFDANDGAEVVGIFAGPTVVVRTPTEMIHAHADRVVVATGAAAILPVCPGAELEGIYTVDAAAHLTAAGLDLGRAVTITEPPDRFEGDGEGRVSAVVVAGQRVECDSVVCDLGTTPRDVLARMGAGLPVEVVGDAAIATDPPPCPSAGVVCPCNDTTMDDLRTAWNRGFTDMELLKRASLAGTGTCQGAMCTPYLRSFILENGGRLEPAFTARPVARQATLGELAAGRHHPVVPRTALHDAHVEAGATMDRLGGWWRPWTYGDTDAEYAAVRNAVSIGDVGTLGSFVVSGPDAEAALQRLVPTDVSTIRVGRSRYVLLLDERGYVLDDGMILALGPDADGGHDRYVLTVTSGGASMAEMWVRDWTADLDVRWMNTTMSLGAINVTGPRAAELMARAGFAEPLRMLGHVEADVAGVPCRVVRLSFTGELSYELHHPARQSVDLWRSLLDLGADLGIRPHGLDALTRLRLEKGHLIVGQDTDYDSTPRRLQHEWMVNFDRGGDFIGRAAVERTDRQPLDKLLVGLEADGPAPFEGAVAWRLDGDYAGYVTSSAWSPTLERAVMLAWIRTVDGEIPDEVTIEGQVARRVPVPFYDPEGVRPRA